MGERAKKVVEGVVAVLSIAVGLALSGAVATTAQALGVYAYPTFFGLSMLLSGAVLLVPWFRRRAERREQGRVPKGRLGRSWARFLGWATRQGTFWVVLTTTFVLGPVVGAVAARALGISDRRAWAYLFFSNLVSVGFWMSLYIGGFHVIKLMLTGLF